MRQYDLNIRSQISLLQIGDHVVQREHTLNLMFYDSTSFHPLETSLIVRINQKLAYKFLYNDV